MLRQMGVYRPFPGSPWAVPPKSTGICGSFWPLASLLLLVWCLPHRVVAPRQEPKIPRSGSPRPPGADSPHRRRQSPSRRRNARSCGDRFRLDGTLVGTRFVAPAGAVFIAACTRWANTTRRPRHQRVRLAVSLELRHFDDGFEPHPYPRVRRRQGTGRKRKALPRLARTICRLEHGAPNCHGIGDRGDRRQAQSEEPHLTRRYRVRNLQAQPEDRLAPDCWSVPRQVRAPLGICSTTNRRRSSVNALALPSGSNISPMRTS